MARNLRKRRALAKAKYQAKKEEKNVLQKKRKYVKCGIDAVLPASIDTVQENFTEELIPIPSKKRKTTKSKIIKILLTDSSTSDLSSDLSKFLFLFF